MPQLVTFASAYSTHFNSAALYTVMCLHISSRTTLRWPAASLAARPISSLAARPIFCTSSRSLVNSAMQGDGWPPPNGEAWGGDPAPIGDTPGAGAGEAAGAPWPGHGAGAAARGVSVGQGSVWAAAGHIGSTVTTKMRERR